MPLSPLRIAILEADTPLLHVLETHGTYGDIFTSLLHKAADALSLPREQLKISKWDVEIKMEYPEIDDVDAILITGSRHNAFDFHPWILNLVAFTKKILSQRRVRIIGVCYGHQIVGRALGAPVARSEGGAWEVSVCNVNLTTKGKELFKPKNQDDDDVAESELSIFQMHRDILLSYPPEVIPLGSSTSCEVQGMYVPKRLITVQGHPEFTEDVVRELLESRKDLGIFDVEIYKDAIGRIGKRQDGVEVACGFLRFLLEE